MQRLEISSASSSNKSDLFVFCVLNQQPVERALASIVKSPLLHLLLVTGISLLVCVCVCVVLLFVNIGWFFNFSLFLFVFFFSSHTSSSAYMFLFVFSFFFFSTSPFSFFSSSPSSLFSYIYIPPSYPSFLSFFPPAT